MGEIRHLVVGLQESGKTTFIAALWYLVEMGEVATELKKGPHIGDHVYLNQIAETWERCEPLIHTKFGRFQMVRMNLVGGAPDSSIAVEFPDLSGEIYEKMFADRVCPKILIDSIDPQGGIVLFLSARRKIDDVTILDFERVRRAQLGDAQQESRSEVEKAKAAEKDPPWDAARTPQQVQIVDVLQMLQSGPFPERRLKIAVIISAWDLVKNRTPAEWLSEKMPMLSQYLHTNPDHIDFRTYGVSAQGGKLRGVPSDSVQGDADPQLPDDRERLLRYTKASERIQIVGPNIKPHDLTAPIAWLSERP
jgi:hypothetical protein